MRLPGPPVRLVGGDRVEFRFQPEVWGCSEPEAVRLTGSFTGWSPQLFLNRRWGRWSLVLPRSEVEAPGNSGEPEFQFVAGDRWLTCPDITGWPRVGDNAVVPLRALSSARRESNHRIAQTLKTRLEEYADPRELANFRSLVPGRLYRSYHPFLASRETPVERPRLAAVGRLMVEERIGAVINLTDGPGVLSEPGVPSVYLDLARRGDVLFAETSYEDAYYRPDGPAFLSILGRILGFVAGRPGPYLVHCRLGMDRTGVVSALLGALGGLSWATLTADYQKSNRLGIREYRDEAFLAYPFRRLLGREPSLVTDLGDSVAASLIQRGLPSELVLQTRFQLSSPRRPSR